MKTICIYVLLLIAFPAFSQNKEARKSLSEMSVLADKSVSDHNTYCLVKYHNEKMIGLFVEIGSVALGGASVLMWSSESNLTTMHNSTHGLMYSGSKYPNFVSSPAGIVSIIAGVGVLAGIGIHLDAEKWINRKHLKFTGDKLTLNF